MLHSYNNYTNNASELYMPRFPSLSLLAYDLTNPRTSEYRRRILCRAMLLTYFLSFVVFCWQRRSESIAYGKRKKDLWVGSKSIPTKVIRDRDDKVFWSVSGVSFVEPCKRNLCKRRAYKLSQ